MKPGIGILLWACVADGLARSSGKRIASLAGHSSSVYSLAYSGEGTLLASGGADCTVKLWDVAKVSLPDL